VSEYHVVTKNDDGFTLLEVLAAFVILAGSIGLIYNFLMSGMGRSEISSAQMTAILIAESKLAESEMLPSQAEGEIDGFHWAVSRTPQNRNGGNTRRQPLKLDQIKVIVTWRGIGGERQYKLESLRPAVQ